MSLLTSAPISSLAVELLRRELVLVNTVSRVPGADYDGPSGGTVTIRVPQPRAAHEQVTPGAAITLNDIDETPVNVTLRHFYDATRVTDEDLTLSIQDFGRQILLPQVAAVAESAEARLASVMNDLDPDPMIEWISNGDDDETEATVLAARERMSADGVPAGGRFMGVAPDIATQVLKVDKFTKVNERGSASALEDATIGQLYGFTFVESPGLEAGTAVAYHQSAFGFGNRPPAVPSNVDGHTLNEGGVSLRHILAFDATRLATVSVVSVFAGASVVPDDDDTIKRAIRIESGLAS